MKIKSELERPIGQLKALFTSIEEKARNKSIAVNDIDRKLEKVQGWFDQNVHLIEHIKMLIHRKLEKESFK